MSVDPYGLGIENCIRCSLGFIFPVRARLYTSISAMVCTLRARFNSAMVTVFHALSINIYSFMYGVSCRQLNTKMISGWVAS